MTAVQTTSGVIANLMGRMDEHDVVQASLGGEAQPDSDVLGLLLLLRPSLAMS